MHVAPNDPLIIGLLLVALSVSWMLPISPVLWEYIRKNNLRPFQKSSTAVRVDGLQPPPSREIS